MGGAAPVREGPTVGGVPPVRAVLLAHPAGHSLSPVMHDAAFAAVGLAGRYEAWDVPPSGLRSAVARLRGASSLLGANVTVPHKEAVRDLLDGCTPIAGRIGSVNTIVRRGDRLVGDTTDGAGFHDALAEAGIDPVAGRVVVLGAGGAARAVVAALLEAGARVGVHNRDAARAASLARDLAGVGTAGAVEVLPATALPGAVRRCSLLVNTTTVGMQGGPPGSPLPDGLLPDAGAVVDLVYRPRTTPLLAAAAAAGLRTQDGLPMLVHQGARAFEAWTGLPAPVEAMRRTVAAALGG